MTPLRKAAIAFREALVTFHKDIEIYDSDARNYGSIDPIKGTLRPNTDIYEIVHRMLRYIKWIIAVKR